MTLFAGTHTISDDSLLHTLAAGELIVKKSGFMYTGGGDGSYKHISVVMDPASAQLHNPSEVARAIADSGVSYLRKLSNRSQIVIIDRSAPYVGLYTAPLAPVFGYTVNRHKNTHILLWCSPLKTLIQSMSELNISDRTVHEYLVSGIPPQKHNTWYPDIGVTVPGEITVYSNNRFTHTRIDEAPNQEALFDRTYKELVGLIERTASVVPIALDQTEHVSPGFAKKLSDKFSRGSVGLLRKQFRTAFDNVDPAKEHSDPFRLKLSELSTAKQEIFQLLLKRSFAENVYWNAIDVMCAFQNVIDGRVKSAEMLTRIIICAVWFERHAYTQEIAPDAALARKREAPKKILVTNGHPGKQLKLVAQNVSYYRFPIRTEYIRPGDPIEAKVGKYVVSGLRELHRLQKYKPLTAERWFAVVSEKIVAISQGRSRFIWEIHPGPLATFLSTFVTRTDTGIGLGSPWTMQLAIEEVGVVRILLASLFGVIGKYLGRKGLFYVIAGNGARAIDGPTEYSLYPSNVSAKCAPKDPKKVAKQITAYLRKKLPKSRLNTFDGVAIIDANDIGQNVLGNDTPHKAAYIEAAFSDNPMGQADEQTPIAIVYTS